MGQLITKFRNGSGTGTGTDKPPKGWQEPTEAELQRSRLERLRRLRNRLRSLSQEGQHRMLREHFFGRYV